MINRVGKNTVIVGGGTTRAAITETIPDSYHNSALKIISYEHEADSEGRFVLKTRGSAVLDNGFTDTSIDRYEFNKSFLWNDYYYYLSEVEGIWWSADGLIIEQSSLTDGTFYDFLITEEKVYLFGETIWSINQSGVFTQEENEGNFSYITHAIEFDSQIVLGTYDKGVYIFNPTGAIGSRLIPTTFTKGRVMSLDIYSNTLYISTEFMGIKRMSVAGVITNTNITADSVICASIIDGGMLFSLENKGIWRLNFGGSLIVPTNLSTLTYRFIQPTSRGVFVGGHMTGIHVWSASTFVEAKANDNDALYSCIEWHNEVFFVGSKLYILGASNTFEAKSCPEGYHSFSLPSPDILTGKQSNYLYAFSNNGGIDFLSRYYTLIDVIQIMIVASDGIVTYEEFLEGDRIVVLTSQFGYSKEFCLQYGQFNMVDIDTVQVAQALIDDTKIVLNKTWSSSKINSEIGTQIGQLQITIDGGDIIL